LSSAVKIVAFTAIIGAGMFLVNQYYQVKNTFSIKLKGFGLPTVSVGILTLPIDLQFNNTTGMAISIPDFMADIFLKRQGQWQNVVQVKQSVELPAGISVKRITARINLLNTIGNDVLKTIKDTIQNRSIEIKGIANGTANGIPLHDIEIIPPQTITI
jgi:hypothetical protein